MQITGGRLRGRRLQAPGDRRVRPTASRTREALFNLLAHGPYAGNAGPMPEGVDVLDAFAGAGTLGFEAASRGAAHVTFLETDRDAHRLITANARTLALGDTVSIFRRDATQPGPGRRRHGLVLLDAPYDSDQALPALTALHQAGWLTADAIVAIEQARRDSFDAPGGFTLSDDRRYGAARLIILRAGTD